MYKDYTKEELITAILEIRESIGLTNDPKQLTIYESDLTAIADELTARGI